GHEHLSPEAVVVPADRTDVLVDVVVASPDLAQCVSGVVVDTAGRPVVGVDVCVHQPGLPGHRSERTFGGGRFHVPGLLRERGPVTLLRIGDGHDGAKPLEYRIVAPRDLEVAPGTADLRVVVAPVRQVTRRVRLFDGRSGDPLRRFRHGLATVLHRTDGTAFAVGDDLVPWAGALAEHPG